MSRPLSPSGIIDLSHHSFHIFKHIVSQYHLNLSTPVSSTFTCNNCHCNKSHKSRFANSYLSSSQPLEIIFSDVWTSPIVSHDDFKYHVIFVDHFTKYVHMVLPSRRKSNVHDIFICFKALVENYFSWNIITLYTDNGGEYQALASSLY